MKTIFKICVGALLNEHRIVYCDQQRAGLQHFHPPYFSDADSVVFDDAGPSVIWDNPAVCAAAIRDF